MVYALSAIILYLGGWAYDVHRVYRAIESGYLSDGEEKDMKRYGVFYHAGIVVMSFFRWPYTTYLRVRMRAVLFMRAVEEYWS